MARSSRWPLPPAALALSGLGAAWLLRAALRVFRRYDFEGKVVVITGGSRGLGLALAEELGRRGACIALCGRDKRAVAEAERRLRQQGVPVLARSVDLGDRAEAELFIDRAAAEWDGIDVLVNNAGVIQVAPAETLPLASIEEAMRSNFWSAVHCTYCALPYLKERKGARIVNVVSFGGRVAVPHLLGYSASKFALQGFSEGLFAELRRSEIAVTTVLPGPMRTGSFYNAEFAGKARRELEWFSLAASIPLVTVSARRAARRIVRAARRGDVELLLGPLTPVFSLLHGVAPRLTQRLMSLVNRFLPGSDGRSTDVWRGRELGSELGRSRLRRLGHEAALRYNEAPPTAGR